MWEIMPLVHFVTEFVKENPDVRVLVPSGLPKAYLKRVWGDVLAPGQLVSVGKNDRCVHRAGPCRAVATTPHAQTHTHVRTRSHTGCLLLWLGQNQWGPVPDGVRGGAVRGAQ